MVSSDDLSPKTGVTYCCNADGIHEYHFYDMNTATINKWYDSMTDIENEAMICGNHVRFMFYIYSVWITAHGVRLWLQTGRNVTSTHKSSSAIILVDFNSVTLKLIQMAMRQMPQSTLQARQIFLEETKGTEWLKQREQMFSKSV